MNWKLENKMCEKTPFSKYSQLLIVDYTSERIHKDIRLD